MRVKNLYGMWNQHETSPLSAEAFTLKLPVDDVARIEALAMMFPHRGTEGIITDLLSAAVTELEERLPYIEGTKVIAHDEEGNPIYEDVGPTPRYLELLQKYKAK